jgi:hypothetical protein
VTPLRARKNAALRIQRHDRAAIGLRLRSELGMDTASLE